MFGTARFSNRAVVAHSEPQMLDAVERPSDGVKQTALYRNA